MGYTSAPLLVYKYFLLDSRDRSFAVLFAVLAVLLSSPSWTSKFLVSALRLLLCIPEVCSPIMKAVDKTKTSALTLRAATRALKIQISEDVDVLRSPV